MKTLYAVPWYTCNLQCPHCNVRNRKFTLNFSKFIHELRNSEADNIVLFGGEPTLMWDKFCECIWTDKVNSVSTNLVVYDENFTRNTMAPLLNAYDVDVATSWNFTRFTMQQMGQWLTNVNVLVRNNIDVLVMITLTQDLLEANLRDVYDIFGIMEQAGIETFLFEPYIGSNEVNNLADEWLVKFHKGYKGKMHSMILDRLEDWNCDCDEVQTLEPDGTILKGCPDSLVIENKTFCNECLLCDKSNICRPCMLQKSCSYPKKLYEFVKGK